MRPEAGLIATPSGRPSALQVSARRRRKKPPFVVRLIAAPPLVAASLQVVAVRSRRKYSSSASRGAGRSSSGSGNTLTRSPLASGGDAWAKVTRSVEAEAVASVLGMFSPVGWNWKATPRVMARSEVLPLMMGIAMGRYFRMMALPMSSRLLLPSASRSRPRTATNPRGSLSLFSVSNRRSRPRTAKLAVAGAVPPSAIP